MLQLQSCDLEAGAQARLDATRLTLETRGVLPVTDKRLQDGWPAFWGMHAQMCKDIASYLEPLPEGVRLPLALALALPAALGPQAACPGARPLQLRAGAAAACPASCRPLHPAPVTGADARQGPTLRSAGAGQPEEGLQVLGADARGELESTASAA